MQGILVSLGVMLVCFVFLIVAQFSGSQEQAIAAEVNSSLPQTAIEILSEQSLNKNSLLVADATLPDVSPTIAENKMTENTEKMVSTISGLKYVELKQGDGRLQKLVRRLWFTTLALWKMARNLIVRAIAILLFSSKLVLAK